MVRDTKILDYLSGLRKEHFSGTVYRATTQTLDPVAPSVAGGRWMLPNSMAVLYTTIERDGALAELSFYLGKLTPLPSKPMVIHEIEVEAKKVIRVTRQDFAPLGIDESRFADIFYEQTQRVGDAAGFLGYDGLIVPCARWNCNNLVIFSDNHAIDLAMNVKSSETVDWQPWACKNGFIKP